MPAPQISPLPTPPSRSQSPDTFSTDADAFLGALPDFQAEANDQADYLDALAIQVDADATTASNAAATAAGAANYMGDYNAGTTYQIGESVSYNGRRYVAKTVNTGVTPADGANWFLINDGDVLGPASATNNALAVFDGTTGKMLKSPLGNGTLGAIIASGGAGNPPSFLGQGTSGQALLSGGAGANPTWGSVFPSQTGNAGKFLQTDGSTTSWANAGGSVGDITYSTQAPTASWIACNGAIYLKATYPDLATKLGQLSNPYNMVFTSANRSGYYLDGIAKIGSTWYLSAYQYGINNSFALYSSSDLSTWTTLISPSASQLGYPIVVPSLSRLVFHQPKSVAYANSPYTSTTTSTISGQATDWYGFYDYSGTNGGMAFDGNTTFVVAGSRRPYSDSDYARIAVSTNSGASFATISTPISGFGNAGTYCSGCVYGAGKFVVCGNISGANNCEIMYSTNGSSWTKVVLPNGSGSTTGDIVFVGNKFWVSSSSVNKLWTSADAITWTEYTTKPTGIGTVSTFHMSEVPSLNLIFWMASGSLTSTYYYSLDGGATWITNTISYATNPAMLFEKWNRSTVGGYIWPRFTSNGTYTVLYTAGYDYNPSTQFKVPTFSSLSTLSGTYTAPVTAFIKAI